MKVIAIKGRSECGKTPTLTLVHKILLERGYTQVPGEYEPQGNDFIDVIEKNGVKIGFATQGDWPQFLPAYLARLDSKSCIKAVAACRTRGGTKDAVMRYSHEFVDKTIVDGTEADELAANQKDSAKIIELITNV